MEYDKETNPLLAICYLGAYDNIIEISCIELIVSTPIIL